MIAVANRPANPAPGTVPSGTKSTPRTSIAANPAARRGINRRDRGGRSQKPGSLPRALRSGARSRSGAQSCPIAGRRRGHQRLKCDLGRTNFQSVTRRQRAVGSGAAPRSGPCFLRGTASENAGLCGRLQPVLRGAQGDIVQMARPGAPEQDIASSRMRDRQTAILYCPRFRDSRSSCPGPSAHLSGRAGDAAGSRDAFRKLPVPG